MTWSLKNILSFFTVRQKYPRRVPSLPHGRRREIPGRDRDGGERSSVRLIPAACRPISSRPIVSCADVPFPSASSFRAGGFGGFKKKGKFGRGNVRKRTNDDSSDDDAAGASGGMAQVEKKKKTMALGGSTARDEKVGIFRSKRALSRTSRFAARLNALPLRSQDKLKVFTFEGDRSMQQRGDGGECATTPCDSVDSTETRSE